MEVEKFSLHENENFRHKKSITILAVPALTQNRTFFDDFDDLNNWWVHVVPDSHNDEYQVTPYGTDLTLHWESQFGTPFIPLSSIIPTETSMSV